jgi:hypothetical protein
MTRWQIYWLVWFGVTFLAFIVPELWALFTNAKNTLSWQVWNLEQFLPGSHTAWTWTHWLVGGILFVGCLWLAFHFMFGWIR